MLANIFMICELVMVQNVVMQCAIYKEPAVAL